MNTLNEELKKFKLLSSYDTNLTLSENYEINYLNEQPKNLFIKLLGGDIKAISNTIKDFSLFKGDVASAENFIRNAAKGKAAKSDLAIFTKDVLKDGSNIKNANPGLFDGAVESYSKNLFNNNKEAAAMQFRNASEADRLVLLKDKGYSESSANAIVKKYKDLEVAAGTVTKDAGTVVKDAGTVTKDAGTVTKDAGTVVKDAEAVAKDSKNIASELKTDSNFMNAWNKVKGWNNWGRVRKWAIRGGIAALALWYFMKDSGDPLPPDFPTTPPTDDNTGGSTGGSTGGGGGTTYTIPSELGDTAGVQKFQDWLDTNHSGWHNKYGTLNGSTPKGYGKFGPRTNSAWNQYKSEYLGGTALTPKDDSDVNQVDSDNVDDIYNS